MLVSFPPVGLLNLNQAKGSSRKAGKQTPMEDVLRAAREHHAVDAIRNDDLPALEDILREDAGRRGTEAVDRDHLLHKAVFLRHIEAISLLLFQYNADPNSIRKYGDTPMQKLLLTRDRSPCEWTDKRQATILRLLLESGADVCQAVSGDGTNVIEFISRQDQRHTHKWRVIGAELKPYMKQKLR